MFSCSSLYRGITFFDVVAPHPLTSNFSYSHVLMFFPRKTRPIFRIFPIHLPLTMPHPHHPLSVLPAGPASIAQLFVLFNASPDVICLFDADGRFTYVSAACRPVWGYSPDELIGRRSLEFVHPDDAAATEAVVNALVNGSPANTFENRYRTADGRYVPVMWSAGWDAASHTFFCIARDGSERQHGEEEADAFRSLVQLQQEALIRRQQETEEELRRSNERFRLATHTDAIYDWDLAANEVHWGEGLHTLFGYNGDDFQMQHWIERIHPEDEPSLTSNLTAALQDPTVNQWEVEYRLARPDGTWCHAHGIGYIIRDEQGAPLRVVGRLQDISERKRREEELQKLSLITQQTEDGIVLTDAEKRTTWVNDAFTRITGYTLEDMLGRRPVTVLEGPNLSSEQLAAIDAKYQTKKPFTLEALNYRKDGTPIWSIISIQPLLDAQGNVLEYFSIRKDITERKRLEQQLEQQRKEMTAAVIAAQEKERSDMSQELHDNVNQVLTTVKLYQELILSGIGKSDELARKSMDLLQTSIHEIRSISKRLSAPSLGKIHLHESMRELTDAVAATNKLIVSLDTDAILDYEIAQDAHIALYRILQEQLTNVLKHAHAREVHIAFSLDANTLTMEITDDGVGFRPTDRHAGTGLTNMRSRAEGLRGTLEVLSRPGQGCSITVRLPR
ncbi:MAG: PAS domain S-box protein [Chitinophagaceae bacterium]|nr:MAG: PAS domain S-box protein [Chitinophagaceae bacterium]